jgi:hypothetical protein
VVDDIVFKYAHVSNWILSGSIVVIKSEKPVDFDPAEILIMPCPTGIIVL